MSAVPMDFGFYVLTLVLTLGLGFLTYQDRLFGVCGILVGFVSGAFLYASNANIQYNSVYSVTGTAVIPYAIIIVIVTALDISILLHISRENNRVLRDGDA